MSCLTRRGGRLLVSVFFCFFFPHLPPRCIVPSRRPHETIFFGAVAGNLPLVLSGYVIYSRSRGMLRFSATREAVACIRDMCWTRCDICSSVTLSYRLREVEAHNLLAVYVTGRQRADSTSPCYVLPLKLPRTNSYYCVSKTRACSEH